MMGDGSFQVGCCELMSRDFLPTTALNLDEDELFKAATDYRSWTFKSFTLKDLPAFDSSVAFGITVEDEDDNIKEEIKKLVHFMSSKKTPLFDSCGALGETNAAGFEDLINVVDQIRSNLEIVMHDNASLAMGNYVHNLFYKNLKKSRAHLRLRYLGRPHGIDGHNPKTLSDENKNAQAYNALIDFTFHSFAWWIAYVAESKSWHAPIIAVLVRWSVKLKLIALDPVRWAERALLGEENIMKQIAHNQQNGEKIIVRIPSETSETPSQEVNFPDDRDLDYIYYLSKFHFRKSIRKFIDRILNNLIAERSSTDTSTPFEVRTLIYKDNSDETPRQLTVQQNGRVETSSDLTDLRRSYRALQLLLSNARSISPTNVNESFSEMARIHWHRSRGCYYPDVGSVSTTRLDDVVSVLVPLSFMGSSHSLKFLENPLIRDDSNDEFPLAVLNLSPEASPMIKFSLSTRPSRKSNLQRTDSRMIPTSRAPLMLSMEGKWHLVCRHFV